MQLLLALSARELGATTGGLVRCAAAFGVSALLVVGGDSKPGLRTQGAHGAQRHVALLHFAHWEEARDFLWDAGCEGRIAGLATQSGSVAQLGVWDVSDRETLSQQLRLPGGQYAAGVGAEDRMATALVLEGQHGWATGQREVCDAGVCVIPLFHDSASVDDDGWLRYAVDIAVHASIAMHHIVEGGALHARAAGSGERGVSGQKFVKDEVPNYKHGVISLAGERRARLLANEKAHPFLPPICLLPRKQRGAATTGGLRREGEQKREFALDTDTGFVANADANADADPGDEDGLRAGVATAQNAEGQPKRKKSRAESPISLPKS